MKTTNLLFAMLAVLVIVQVCIAQTGSKSDKKSCWDSANSQYELNQCAGSEFKKADDELNRVYSELTRKLDKDSVGLEALKQSQRAWLKFRDAQMKALHPHPEEEGSVRPMCSAIQMAEITLDRVKTLRAMLNTEEGDVCDYSVSP